MKLINSLPHTNNNLTSPGKDCWPVKRNSTGLLLFSTLLNVSSLTIKSLAGYIGMNRETVKVRPNPRQAASAPSPHYKGPLCADTALENQQNTFMQPDLKKKF